MSAPLDPNDTGNFDNPSATGYSYGRGMVNPNKLSNVDYGRDLPFPKIDDGPETKEYDYDNIVADRRTDSTDPGSTRDFTVAGNPDRFGAQPALIKEPLIKHEPPTPNPNKIKTAVERAE